MVTFDSVMNFYNSNKENFYSLIDNIKKGLVTPFIGAGMSYFVYPQWKKVLKEFADLVNDSNRKEQVINHIEKGNTIAAANALEDILGNRQISEKLLNVFNRSKLDKCSDTEIFAAPISLLPLILPDASVITTNYDHVLECVYEKRSRRFTDDAFTPYSTELTSQFLQQRPHCLYKIHGSIDTDTIDYRSIIFTESQYDERYNNTDSIGRKSLINLYRSHTMLFLGCSLDKDRTLDLFKSVCEDSGSGLKHFAILQCEEKGNLDSRAKELTDKYNIFPIFYQGDHNESIRAILEEILRIINPELYRQHTTPKPIGKNKFLYNSGAVKFCGRDRELKICREFVQSEDKLQYMIIEGAGGSGKSRLAFEFGNELKETGWGVKELKGEDYDNLSKLTDNITENKLFIADYAARCSDKLSDLIERLSNKINDSIPYKVRIIMLERDSENDDLSNNSFKASNWKQSFYNRKIKEFLFTNDEMQNNVLKLNVLDDNALCEIMKSFAESDGKTLDDNTANKLLEALKRVDRVLLRPLFALFIVYAWCSGEDATSWSKEKVLDYMFDRETDLYRQSAESFLGINRNDLEYFIFPILDKLLLIATANSDISTDDFKIRYSDMWQELIEEIKELKGTSNTNKAERIAENLLNHSGICDNNTLKAIRPDLIGEYFVLKTLYKYKKENATDLLFYDRWADNIKFLNFFNMLYYDYHEYIYGDFKELGIVEKFLNGYPSNDEAVVIYAIGLVYLSAKQDLESGINDTIDKLEKLYNKHNQIDEIVVVYAKGLVNLSAKQDLESGINDTIDKLEKLYNKHKSIDEIVVVYANGLVNLSAKQDLDGCIKTIAKLKELYNEHKSIDEVVVEYASGLFNLSNMQDLDGRIQTIDKLEELYNKHKSIDEFVVRYAMGLVNLSAKQDLDGCIKTIAKLKELYNKHKSIDEIVVVYANGLVNLSAKQDLDGRIQTIDKLEKLYNKHKSIDEIVAEYAKGLVNLSFKQDLESGINDTIDKLEELYNEHKNIDEFVVRYAMGLVNLSIAYLNSDKLNNAKEKFNEAEALCTVHSENAALIDLFNNHPVIQDLKSQLFETE